MYFATHLKLLEDKYYVGSSFKTITAMHRQTPMVIILYDYLTLDIVFVIVQFLGIERNVCYKPPSDHTQKVDINQNIHRDDSEALNNITAMFDSCSD